MKKFFYVLFIFLSSVLFAPTQSEEIQKVAQIPVFMLWDPAVFQQWEAVQYIHELRNRFRPQITVSIFFAANNEESQRQLILLKKGTDTLFHYTQGKMLIPNAGWQEALLFTGVSSDEVSKEIISGAGMEAFTKQQIPEKLLREYRKKQFPVLAINDTVYPDPPTLLGWASFIEKFISSWQKTPELQKETSAPGVPAALQLLVIEDPVCLAGKLDDRLLTIFQQFDPQISIRKINRDVPEGIRNISRFQSERLPLYIFDERIRNYVEFWKLVERDLLTINKDQYLFNIKGMNTCFFKRPRIKNDLKIFVVPFCSSCIAAEEALIKNLKQRKQEDQIMYSVNYLLHNGSSPEEPFLSPNGRAEWEEAARQKIIQKYMPEQFYKYLCLRNRMPESSIWHTVVRDAGIDLEFIMEKFEEGKKLLAEDVILAENLGVFQCPSFLWENQELYLGIEQLNKLDPFKNIQPLKRGVCGESHY